MISLDKKQGRPCKKPPLSYNSYGNEITSFRPYLHPLEALLELVCLLSSLR